MTYLKKCWLMFVKTLFTGFIYLNKSTQIENLHYRQHLIFASKKTNKKETKKHSIIFRRRFCCLFHLHLHFQTNWDRNREIELKCQGWYEKCWLKELRETVSSFGTLYPLACFCDWELDVSRTLFPEIKQGKDI